MASDPSGGPSDPFAKLMLRARKRKAASQSAQGDSNLPHSKVARIGHGKKQHHHQHHLGGAAAVAAVAARAEQHLDDWEGYVDDDDVQDDEADGLPMEVSTVLDAGQQEALEPWSLITKGFFHAKGTTFRAGYTVHHRGLCIARAIFWNDEFDEVRFQHQGPCPSLASVATARGASTMTHVSVGLMAVLDALAYARTVRCCWQVFVDNNLEVLRLVDMYQRNWKFLKYHAERLLLHQIMECARQQAGRIHLRRK